MEILKLILGFLGLGGNPVQTAVDGLNTAYANKLKAQNDSDKLEAQKDIERWHATVQVVTLQAQAVQTAMGHRIFWVAWFMFVLPLAAWWAAVLADTIFPVQWNIAEIPPQLVPWANSIFQNVFVSGAAVAGITGGAKIAAQALARRA